MEKLHSEKVSDAINKRTKTLLQIATEAVTTTPFQAGEKAGVLPQGTNTAASIAALGAVSGGLAFGGAGVGVGGGATGFIHDKFIQGILLSSVLNLGGKLTEQQINKIIPIDSLRLSNARDLYIYAPDNSIRDSARKNLEDLMAEAGIQGAQPGGQRFQYLAAADADRQAIEQVMPLIPSDFAVPGQTQQQIIADFISKEKAQRDKAQSDLLGQQQQVTQQQQTTAMNKAQFLQEAAAAGLPDITDVPARERLFQRNPQLKAAFNALQFQESTTPPAPNPTPDQLLGGAPFPTAPTAPIPSGGTATKTPTEIALGTSLPEDLKNLSPDEVRRRASQTGGVSTR